MKTNVTLCIKFLLLKSFLLFAHDKYRLKHLFLTFVVLRFISFLISLYHVTLFTSFHSPATSPFFIIRITPVL